MSNVMCGCASEALMKFPKSYTPLVLADGHEMSVQGNRGVYCSPREDGAVYTAVEVGYPTFTDARLLEHIERSEASADPTESVYPWTPVEVVLAVIMDHGGIASGELPPMRFGSSE